MSQFEVIDDVIYNIADGNIVRQRKNPVVPALISVVGVALTVWSLASPEMKESANLSSSLMLLGFVLILIGIIRLIVVMKGRVPFYKPTSERLRRSEMFYDAKDKWTVCNAIEAGNIEVLNGIPKSDASGVLLTVYTTPSGSFTAAQVSEYVPHQFVPVTGIVQFAEEKGRTLAALV